MARRTYTQEQKATALAGLLTGIPAAQIAAEMGIPTSTIFHWKQVELNPTERGMIQTVQATTAYEKKEEGKEELGELVTEYLRESLRTLRLQAREFASHDWLQKQSANDVAILHGVLADKTIRVLSAIHSLD